MLCQKNLLYNILKCTSSAKHVLIESSSECNYSILCRCTWMAIMVGWVYRDWQEELWITCTLYTFLLSEDCVSYSEVSFVSRSGFVFRSEFRSQTCFSCWEEGFFFRRLHFVVSYQAVGFVLRNEFLVQKWVCSTEVHFVLRMWFLL